MNIINVNSKNSTSVSKQLFAASLLCNNASYIDSNSLSHNQREAKGDATDIALLRFGSENFFINDKSSDFNLLKEVYTELAEIPFNSKNKWMMKFYSIKDLDVHDQIFNKSLNENSYLMLVKGAPDILLA